MELIRPRLPSLVEGEAKTLLLQLRPGLAGKTITAVSFESIPAGLRFSNERCTEDGSTSVSATVHADAVGSYVIVATSTLSNGDIDKTRALLDVAAEDDV